MRIVLAACDWISRLAMLVMMAAVVVEIVCRDVLGISLQLSDELGGYLLVVIAFLSLAVTQSEGAFHQVTFVQDRLPPRARAGLNLGLDLLSLAFLLLLAWQLGRLEVGSWDRGDQSDTLLAMPLWIPRAAMVVGIAALAATVGQTALRTARLAFVRGR